MEAPLSHKSGAVSWRCTALWYCILTLVFLSKQKVATEAGVVSAVVLCQWLVDLTVLST